MSQSPVIYCIRGYKNSGKTTLMKELICVLVGKGYKVASIKHDGHDFESDVPGTDSYSHAKAGAYGTAVFSKDHWMITKRGYSVTEQDLIQLFPEADVILIEGLKDSEYPGYWCDFPKREPPVADLAKEIEYLLSKRQEMKNQ